MKGQQVPQGEEEIFEIHRAVRHRTAQVLCIYGVQFSGKTFGAFMLAAGLVKPGGKVGFIDTENGRGSVFADDPDIMRVLPQGYDVCELHAPFHPRRYIHAIRQFERAGYDLLIIDSGSHAWEAEGGAQDIKEKDKGWNHAKRWSHKLKFALMYSRMDIIVCLRAQEKTKIVGTGRDQQYVPLGILPICEKSLPFEIGTAIRVEGEKDGQPATHFATPVKWPKALNWLFKDWKPQLLTPDIGRKIREWNESGQKQDETELLKKQARNAAEQGMSDYEAFFKALQPGQRKLLEPFHGGFKQIATAADQQQSRSDREELDGLLDALGADQFYAVLGAHGVEKIEDATAAQRAAAIEEMRGLIG